MRMKKNVIWLLLLMAIPGLLYTNCTVAYEPPEDELASLSSVGEFAYDSQLDQVAFMSCADLGGLYDTSTYFTFRGGAYRTGGIKLADNYFSSISPVVTTVDDKIGYLTQTEANTNTQLQLALRPLTDFQSVYGSGSAAAGRDFSLILDPLGTPEMVEPLIGLGFGQRIRYMRDGTFEGKRFEGSIQMSDKAENLRASIMGRNSAIPGKLFLGLTYTNPNINATHARSPVDFLEEGQTTATISDKNTAYGKGLQIDLAAPPGAYSGYPDYTMSQVREFDLLNRTSGNVNWICPDTLKFKIVRNDSSNVNEAICSTDADPDYAVGSDMWRVRQSLRTEDWYVDPTRRCVVPKKVLSTDCYGSDFSRKVQYNISTQCRFDGGNPQNTDPNQQACSHWVSICYRP